MTIEKNGMKEFVNGPWITRILLGIVIFFAQQFYRDNQTMRQDIATMKADIKVLNVEIKMLTDYNINPKNSAYNKD